jgi:hypothetical protein
MLLRSWWTLQGDPLSNNELVRRCSWLDLLHSRRLSVHNRFTIDIQTWYRLKTYSKEASVAIIHQPMQKGVKPTVLVFIKNHKVILMEYKLLVFWTKRVLCPYPIHEVSVGSFGWSCEFSKPGISQQEIVWENQRYSQVITRKLELAAYHIPRVS